MFDADKFKDFLWMSATNDGDSYRDLDAEGAIKKAFHHYREVQREHEREEYNEIRSGLIRDLAKRWEGS